MPVKTWLRQSITGVVPVNFNPVGWQHCLEMEKGRDVRGYAKVLHYFINCIVDYIGTQGLQQGRYKNINVLTKKYNDKKNIQYRSTRGYNI